jgi:hypothetical protein
LVEAFVVEPPESFVIVATAVFEELQVTEANVSLPPLKFPVAVKFRRDPMGTHGVPGLKVIESSPDGVSDVDWYSSALDITERPLAPPAATTIPFARSTAVWE